MSPYRCQPLVDVRSVETRAATSIRAASRRQAARSLIGESGAAASRAVLPKERSPGKEIPVPMKPLYSGKAKSLYETDDPSVLRMVFRDDVTAFDAEKRATIEGKGRYNAEICASMFEHLERNGVETHFVERTGDAEMLVERLDMFALEVIPRNIATGSLVRKYPFEEGQELEPPVLVMDLKSDEHGDPMLNDDIARALGIAAPDELREIREKALGVNELLLDLVEERNLLLPDFKLEFGKNADGEIVVGDEVSPDTCRFWTEEGRSLDKDVFRFDRGDLAEAYAEAAERILA